MLIFHTLLLYVVNMLLVLLIPYLWTVDASTQTTEIKNLKIEYLTQVSGVRHYGRTYYTLHSIVKQYMNDESGVTIDCSTIYVDCRRHLVLNHFQSLLFSRICRDILVGALYLLLFNFRIYNLHILGFTFDWIQKNSSKQFIHTRRIRVWRLRNWNMESLKQ